MNLNVSRTVVCCLAVCLTIVAARPAPGVVLDPCGMVPPIYIGDVSPIARVGLQQTYVFHKDGVETFVIRPGFTGKVDNFGMLIPFPNPPALRKVADNVFEHIAAAVDPPEVVVDLRLRRGGGFGGGGIGGGGALPQAATMQFDMEKDSVAVLTQEAVGMYEIAVLQAGSAKALKRWMDENGFQYPKGMDKVTEEYIQENWCFVAVKTKVGDKAAVDPKPGQRNVNPNLPAGSVFDGSVQGMGFRFKSEKLVVPMRLSAFNEGEMRNVVYILSDDPKKIRSIPEEYVVRQVRGKQLIKNMTEPLPLRVIGGELKDIPAYRKQQLKTQRDPAPHNSIARQLFASDLLAVRTGELSLGHEETQKELLRIGEHFGLRGEKFDIEIRKATKKVADEAVEEHLKRMQRMTMTVVDGDFPRDVLAGENLTFEKFKMVAVRNKSSVYDTKIHKAPRKLEGKLFGQMDLDTLLRQELESSKLDFRYVGLGVLLFGLGCWTTNLRSRR